MQLGLISGDLMLVSRLDGAARKLGWKLTTAATAAIASAWDRQQIAAVVIDLRTVGQGVGAFAELWHGAGDDAPPLVACGPHVQESLLAAAREAGCAAVVTRGQIDHDAERILAEVVGAE